MLSLWKFSRNRLASLQIHQATHPFFVQILGSWEEPPGGTNWPLGDTCVPTQFSGFLDDTPSDDEHLLGDASYIGSILMFLVI